MAIWGTTGVIYVGDSPLCNKFTYGKLYKPHSFNTFKEELTVNIFDDHNWMHEISVDKIHDYFITREQWREQQINKIIQ